MNLIAREESPVPTLIAEAGKSAIGILCSIAGALDSASGILSCGSISPASTAVLKQQRRLRRHIPTAYQQLHAVDALPTSRGGAVYPVNRERTRNIFELLRSRDPSSGSDLPP